MESSIKDQDKEQDISNIVSEDKKTHPSLISFKHINIRQSIFLLLLKLVTLEVITATIIIVFHVVMFAIKDYQGTGSPLVTFNVYIFVILSILKTLLTGYIILEWYDEYYELSGTDVGHKKGFFIKRHEQVKLEHLTSVKMEQGFFGRIFNFGTIRVHDWFQNKDYFLYQIHNPVKYERVLLHLMPTADHSRKIIRDHVTEEEDE
ncbi:PH domain-containing protein [Candidatus Microgenomates bacterium]|nr:PH domain-containing protein [Candidatus Microgenomates bacterium]